MALLLDIASLLLFPGLVFTAAAGVATLWAVRWLGSTEEAGERVSLGDLARRTDELLDLALHPAPEELDRASGLLLFGVVAAAAASACLWRYVLFPASDGWADLFVLLPLLATPTIVAFGWGDWFARSKGVGRGRDLLLLVYSGVLLLAFCVPAVAARSLWLGQVVHPAGRTLPLALSLGGGLAFLVAVGAATTQLALLDTVWDECLSLVSGAVQTLLVQLLRASNWFAIVSALTMLYLTLPVPPVVAFVAALPGYVVALMLVVAVRSALGRPAARQYVDVGWVPLGLVALVALVLVAGGL